MAAILVVIFAFVILTITTNCLLYFLYKQYQQHVTS